MLRAISVIGITDVNEPGSRASFSPEAVLRTFSGLRGL